MDFRSGSVIGQTISPGAYTSSSTGSGIDFDGTDGPGHAVLVVADADGTLTARLQEADTENGDYTDVALGARSGFTVVNAANNTQIIAFPRSKRWIRGVATLTGTSMSMVMVLWGGKRSF